MSVSVAGRYVGRLEDSIIGVGTAGCFIRVIFQVQDRCSNNVWQELINVSKYIFFGYIQVPYIQY